MKVVLTPIVFGECNLPANASSDGGNSGHLIPVSLLRVGIERASKAAPLDFEGARRRYLKLLNPNRLVCSRCGAVDGVKLEDSRTQYEKSCPFVPTGEDSTFGGCIAGLEGRSCKAGHSDREACPYWPKTDPNADVALCRECAKMHHEYWDEMWAEYNRGRM